jgi:hypothetical protein
VAQLFPLRDVLSPALDRLKNIEVVLDIVDSSNRSRTACLVLTLISPVNYFGQLKIILIYLRLTNGAWFGRAMMRWFAIPPQIVLSIRWATLRLR